MSQEVIELLESDNEAQQRPTAAGTIDLCESSDDEDSKSKKAATAASLPVKSRKVSLSAQANRRSSSARVSRLSSFLDDSSSDEENDLLRRGPIFSNKKPPPAKHHSPSSAAKPPSKPGSDPAARAAKPASRPASLDDNDDDDDDDSLLMSIGLSTTKKPPAQASTSTLAAASRSVPPKPSSQSVPQLHRHEQDLPFCYPKLLSNSKLYPDERARFALSFWKFGRSQTTNSFQRPKLDNAAKRIVEMALAEFPIRSLEEYMQFGNTSVTNARQVRDELRRDLDAGGHGLVQTPVTMATSAPRRYYTIAEACLAALLAHVETILRTKGENPEILRVLDDVAKQEYLQKDKDLWMPLSDLIPAVDQLLRPECPGRLTRRGAIDNGASHYLEQSTRSIEFLQIAKLESPVFGPLIKRRTWKGVCCFELLPAGFKSALLIRTRLFPEPPGHYRCSRIATQSQVDDRYKGVCLGVDAREGGGGMNVLHQMCQKLDIKHVPYFVGTLQIGDYVFFTTKDGGKSAGAAPMDYLCPILVERKSVQDVAQSIHDGRWKNQKRRMYHGQYVFGYSNCRMVYIIEGNQNAQTVSGGYVGARWFNVDKEKLAQEIENLKAEGFEVLQTPSRENTMFQLARWAERIAAELKSGSLKAQYTYAEFKQEVAKIGPNVDFSRLAKDYMRQKKEAETPKRSAHDAELDSDVELLSSAEKEGLKMPASAKSEARKKRKTDDEDDEYSKKSTKELKEKCQEVGLPKTGTRAELLERLRGPHPPKLWLERKRRGEFVPERHNVGGSALLVALHLHEREVGRENAGIIKDDLYTKAEELNITKNPFSGGTTQTGPYHYDGWSNMKKLLTGDPALVIKTKGRYKLTSSSDVAGQEIAKAIHAWNHEHNNCPCGNPN